jgi:hypothetical protein
MNVINQHKERRAAQVNEVIETIKRAFGKKMEISRENFVNELCFSLKLSRRTAQEYLDIALTQVPHETEGKGKNRVYLESL